MSFAIVLSLIAVVVTVLFLVLARRAQEVRVSASQIPAVVSQLKAFGKDSSFVVFVFMPEGKVAPEDEEGVNLQYSIENGRIGLDWVLLAPQNIADKEKIAAYIADRGFAANMREMNKVSYLRVENGDVADLGARIATEFYHLDPADQVDLIVDGFDLKPV
jgi:hypothetical protein